MNLSTDTINKIEAALSKGDHDSITHIISDIPQSSGRRKHKFLIDEINNLIVETALKNNMPSDLLALQDIPNYGNEELFARILQQYINSKDTKWLKILCDFIDKLEKKSFKSQIFSAMIKKLIDSGVSELNPVFIHDGITILNRISFRKYRSDILIDIIPSIIGWAVSTRDLNLLHSSLTLVDEISDISKRAVLHAQLAMAIASVAILEKDHLILYDSIREATRISQKIRRQDCVSSIIERAVKSIFGKEMLDIPQFMNVFSDIPFEKQEDIIIALIDQLLERVKDKSQIITMLHSLDEKIPGVIDAIILNLLNKAERSGDRWYLTFAMDFQHLTPDTKEYPIKNIVKAAISIAEHSNDTEVFKEIIPIIEKTCNKDTASRIYLQISRTMLSSGDFNSAISIFSKIDYGTEHLPKYVVYFAQILKEGIIRDQIPLIVKLITISSSDEVKTTAIYHAIIEICKAYPFDDIISHIKSIQTLIGLHPRKEQLLHDGINLLIDRGFLDEKDSELLLNLASLIKEKDLKERTISNIVIKIAERGVKNKNRDFLQRAVGLTCVIDGEETRSATLSTIINKASNLAAQQGDFDLLRRMRTWCSDLLDYNLAPFAMANIVDGMIKYAIDRRSPAALEEAYLIINDINDPSLKNQLSERIIESFVTVGCIIFKDNKSQRTPDSFIFALNSFERGLELIKNHTKKVQISLKIASMIDIIIRYLQTYENPDYIPPLALFVFEIENQVERDAMMSRIISKLHETLEYPDSTDPYEIMSYLLLSNEHAGAEPIVQSLIYRSIRMINDMYIRLTSLCNLANGYIKIKQIERGEEILDEIVTSIPALSAKYQKILVLTDLSIIISRINKDRGKKCLSEALNYLDYGQFDQESITRRQIVYAIVNLNSINPENENINLALSIVEKIEDPVEYINAMIAIYEMIDQDKERCNMILSNIFHAIEKISSPYEKATTFIDVVPLTLKSCEIEIPLSILKKVDDLTKKINISFISDSLRENITHIYCMLYDKNSDTAFLSKAIKVINTIDDDEIRLRLFSRLGYSEESPNNTHYEKIKVLMEKIIKEGSNPKIINSLERLIRTVSDRGKEAIYFSKLAIMCQRSGEGKLSKRMFQGAIKEARIIRPLSRRAYVMADIAMKTHAAGCENISQEMLEMAIEAATNIRQSAIRDVVFDELGLAIKIMQGK